MKCNVLWQRSWRVAVGVLAWLGGMALVQGAGFDYQLAPVQVAPDTWVLVGRTEDFSFKNGGNIVNTGFIVTTEGVVVIDTGPSRQYGVQMRQAIARITPQPIAFVLNTHFHPDHFLGNQAFADRPIYALPETIRGEKSDGDAFLDNMYRMAGDAMSTTEALPATRQDMPDTVRLGGHDLVFLRLAGHTAGDLALFDQTTGVLFAGDLVFNDRAPTTPHADIPRWLASLERLQSLSFKLLVPGHGQPVQDARAIAQTADYLRWLDGALRQGAAEGRDMADMLTQPLPPRFAPLAVLRQEYPRSVSHLFPAIEKSVLLPAPTQ